MMRHCQNCERARHALPDMALQSFSAMRSTPWHTPRQDGCGSSVPTTALAATAVSATFKLLLTRRQALPTL